MPAPAARIRSASVPCGTSSASISPLSTYSLRASRCEARVGAVNEQIAFLTSSLRISHSMVGTSSGILLGQRLVEVDRHAHDGEPAKADHRAVRDVANGVGETGEDFAFGHAD